MNGAYLLVMELPEPVFIRIGKLGKIRFKKGWYVYVGSALNGLDQRLQRHLRVNKKIHWHIDYLLPFTQNISVYVKENNQKEECSIAQHFEKNFYGIPGFGCSDCSCGSHLFYGSYEKIVQEASFLYMKRYQVGNV